MMALPFRLGALDFCTLSEGTGPSETLWQTLELVRTLEALGYDRYWLSEHHVAEVAHASPELLSGILAGLTSRIRVGVAGILLRYYSPLKVANDFRLLQAMFPGRIDLGIARGAVPEPVASVLLEERQSEVPFERKVADLLTYLRDTGSVSAIPLGVVSPQVWMLGTTSKSTHLAARYGTCFCLGLFLASAIKAPANNAIMEYRSGFRRSPDLHEPHWSVAVAGVCAQTEEKARILAADVNDLVYPSVVGTPEQCLEAFEQMRDKYETNEFVFLDVCRAFSDRTRSYQLLAEALA